MNQVLDVASKMNGHVNGSQNGKAASAKRRLNGMPVARALDSAERNGFDTALADVEGFSACSPISPDSAEKPTRDDESGEVGFSACTPDVPNSAEKPVRASLTPPLG